jgi:hypothetical protein
MHDIGLTHDVGQLGGTGLPLSEAHELELASKALGLSDDHELEAFLGDVFHAVGTAAGRFARPETGRELAGMLRGAMAHAVPSVGSGQGLDLPSLAQQAGSLLGLELEGLSPQDQEFEAGRGLVRFLGGAYHHAIGAPRELRPRTVARRAMIGSARRFAPGMLRGYRGGGAGQLSDYRRGWPGSRAYSWPYASGWNRYPGMWQGDGYGAPQPGWPGGDSFPYDPGVPLAHRRHHRHHWYPADPDPGWGYPPIDTPASPGYGPTAVGDPMAAAAPGDPGSVPGVAPGDPTAGPAVPSDLGAVGAPIVPPAVPSDPGAVGAPTVPAAVPPSPPPGAGAPPSAPAQSSELDIPPGEYGFAEPDWGAPHGSPRRGRWERHGGAVVVHGL